MFFDSTADTRVECRKFLLRFFPLLDKIWLLKALLRLILPLPVTLNLFIAALLLLILGTWISFLYSIAAFVISSLSFRVSPHSA